MHEAFNRIIGYHDIKGELDQLGDILRCPEKYQQLGVKVPSGLMLYGRPGLGKSLMAECLIQASGRKCFICRKNLPNGEFVKKIKATFDEAAANAPAVVFLDDMDKFANGDSRHPDSEEYVTVQACIDQVRGKDVFVVATANNLDNLPESLLRNGRFDREIEVKRPSKEDSAEIIRYYLSTKAVDKDLDIPLIARIVGNCSCATLENVLNEAGLRAAYADSETIKMEHFLEACLNVIFNVPGKRAAFKGVDETALQDANNPYAVIAYHEAGHIVVSEALNPGNVTVACVYAQNGNKGGFAAYEDRETRYSLSKKKAEIMGGLGGLSGVEQKFGFRSVGGISDLSDAYEQMKHLVVDQCIFGMEYYSDFRNSPELMAKQERRTTEELERLYQQAKTILAANMPLLDAVARELATKGVITAHDIAELEVQYGLSGAVV